MGYLGLSKEELAARALRSAGATPRKLDEVPAGDRVEETFGAVFLLSGLLALGFAALYVYEPRRGAINIVWTALAALAGLALVGVELYRRRDRATLVRRGPAIGVYRRGALAQTILMSDVTYYKLSIENTGRALLLPLFIGGGCAFFVLNERLAEEWSRSLAVAAVLMFAWCASNVYTRLFCKHYLVPFGRGQAQLLLGKRDAERLFPEGHAED